eukprot:1013255-Pyramimonas_sp.AAC.1
MTVDDGVRSRACERCEGRGRTLDLNATRAWLGRCCTSIAFVSGGRKAFLWFMAVDTTHIRAFHTTSTGMLACAMRPFMHIRHTSVVTGRVPH